MHTECLKENDGSNGREGIEILTGKVKLLSGQLLFDTGLNKTLNADMFLISMNTLWIIRSSHAK